MRPYIPIKDSDGTVFQATHLTAEPEIEVNGDVFYCVVAYDANHGLKKIFTGTGHGESNLRTGYPDKTISVGHDTGCYCRMET